MTQGSIDNYLGQKGTVPQAALGAHAKFLDRNMTSIAAPGPNDVVVWQSPLPGAAFTATDDAEFLVTDKVPVPEVVGMRVRDAELVLAFRGLGTWIVDACGESGELPSEEQQDMMVVQQCVPPGTMYDPGNFVGVVISPWPESSSLVTLTLAALAAMAAGLALVFFMRLRFAKQELDVFKSGRTRPPS
jgi:beta-lactam-binding protein with PASTA domain